MSINNDDDDEQNYQSCEIFYSLVTTSIPESPFNRTFQDRKMILS